MEAIVGAVVGLLAGAAILWLVLELAVRVRLAWPLPIDFYGSVPRERARELGELYGVRAACGHGWVHLGWIADPEQERYRVERGSSEGWREIGHATYGSFLYRGGGGRFRVWAVPRRGPRPRRLLGEVVASPLEGTPPVLVPRIAGRWRPLFRPEKHGFYVNDHAVYRDARGSWRVLGITSRTDGDFDRERWFASGVSRDFPPAAGMVEEEPVAAFGELAWAPWVIEEAGTWHLFWSPHRLHHMTSREGARWEDHRIAMRAPARRFFRDAMVLRVTERQWLLYATARGRYFSRVDLYQSFDLEHWQCIGAALRTGCGSERNSPFASTESPTVTPHGGRFYLSVTYNNDSFFWPGVLLLFKRWRDPSSYNDTLVFQADNPYDFGTYRGRRRPCPTLVARLEAHAPRLVQHPETGTWYITTAGWPWVATLTSGELAVAPLAWDPSEETPAAPRV